MSWDREYPRPQLRRDSFFCLNGSWEVNGQVVQVPYPLQSRLSGWQGAVPERLHYRRTFTLPAGFCTENDRILLHFGAVDQVADVMVNGKPVAHHEGGYHPFCADITDCIVPGENEVIVDAMDTLDPIYPRGKQSKKPGGMWYTPVSGIWQTVWGEAVPGRHAIRDVKITPDTQGFDILVASDAEQAELTVEGRTMSVPCNKRHRVDIDNPRLWSVEEPYLYNLQIKTDSDTVQSYTALRSVDIRVVEGKPRICLNGKPVFLNGVLDQGYFDDGIFLPKDPEAFDQDILRMKELGFNLLRKHIKVEPERFYFACDRLGMLVMQDMVSSGGYNFLLDTVLPTIGLTRRPDCYPGQNRRKEIFRRHCRETVEQLWNHPCVIAYTIFNEGWGQFDADEMYVMCKDLDPHRIWDATSGWFTRTKSDVDSVHVYFRNKLLKGKERPVLLSECGGYARKIEGHLFKQDAKYGYGKTDTEAALTEAIAKMYREMVLPSIPDGLCGVVYTQLSDVEEEINGLYTYDREVCKVNKARMREILAEAAALLE